MMHIRNQIKRLSRLMEDLLALGRPLRKDDFIPIKIHEFLTDTVADWVRIIPDRQQYVHIEVPDIYRSLTIRGDPTKMQQVIVNILDNADQHMMPEGSITISVDRPEAGMLSILCRDTGSGIAPEDFGHIFDPFYTTRKNGTGLGLSIVKNTVEHHGGTIGIFNNNPPPGITIELRMPLARENGI